MNFTKLIISLFLITSVFGCSQQMDSINGHWHLVSPKHGYFNTLDISDSLTVTEYYDLNSLEYYEIPRTHKSEDILPFNDIKYTSTFFIIDDTLNIRQDSLIKKYVKSKISECILYHRYANTFISIDLAENNSALKFELIPKNSCGMNIFVGKLKKSQSHFIDSLSNLFPDSTFIQVNDVPINLLELREYSLQTIEVCSPMDSKLYLHIDKNLPQKFIDRIIRNFPDSSKLILYRVVKMSDGDIGIIKL